jgi:DNA-binding NarL/FixJ family response regulator
VTSSPDNSRTTVLIADDDADIRQLLVQYVSRDPFELVGSARNADEAIALGSELKPDAALVDVNMPGGGARRVVDELRQSSPGTAIVILSGLEEDGLVRGLLRAGAMAYLVKGAGREEILETVRRAVAANGASSA